MADSSSTKEEKQACLVISEKSFNERIELTGRVGTPFYCTCNHFLYDLKATKSIV